jgi:hypothetical protein
MYVPTGSLLGKGSLVTTYRMKALSSTKAGSVPTAAGSTNPYFLLRSGGLGSTQAAKVDIGGLTLQGTDQGHLYNGMQVGYGSGSTLHDLTINGIPGSSSSPPGETASLSLWHADAASLTDVTLDGYRASDGAQVAASLLEYNYTTGANTITNLKSTGARYGFGLAMYRAAGTYTFNGCNLSGNRKAVNIEESIGGTTYNFNGCDFRGTTGAPYVAQVTSINSSSKVYIRDPKVDAWPLKVNCYGTAALSGANKQLDSDIHLIVNGVDVSNDPTKLQITHLYGRRHGPPVPPRPDPRARPPLAQHPLTHRCGLPRGGATAPCKRRSAGTQPCEEGTRCDGVNSVGMVTALAAAVLGLLVVLGLNIDTQKQAAIVVIVGALFPIVSALITRKHVTPVAKEEVN